MTTLSDLPWTEQKKIAAWTACRTLDGYSPTEYRVDAHWNLILWSHYGAQGDYGWEVDHVQATALGGSDSLDNVRALHWRKNRQLGAHVGNALSKAADFAMTQPQAGRANALAAALEGLGGPVTMTGRNGFGFGSQRP